MSEAFAARSHLSTRLTAGVRLLGGLLVVASFGKPSMATDSIPDPLALLRGVEDARQTCKSGRFEFQVKTTYPLKPTRTPRKIRLLASFDGTSRRFDAYQRVVIERSSSTAAALEQDRLLKSMGGNLEAYVRAGHGEFKEEHRRSAYDGTQFLEYSEEKGAVIKDLTKGSPSFVFDPRVLGLSVYFDINYQTHTCLAYEGAKSIENLGKEVIDGLPCWQVKVIDSYDQDRRFWIEDNDSFRVLKCSFAVGPQKLETVSDYDSQVSQWALPRKVVNRKFDASGQVSQVIEITATKTEYNVAVDSRLFSLAGLGMPLGEMVIDDRLHSVVGHFDGKNLSENFSDAVQKGRDSQRRPFLWISALVGLIALATIGAVIARRRNFFREGAS